MLMLNSNTVMLNQKQAPMLSFEFTNCPSLNPPKPSLHVRSRPFGNEFKTISTVPSNSQINDTIFREVTPKPRQINKPGHSASSLERPHQLDNPSPLMSSKRINIPNHDPAKCSIKENGTVKGYAANTNQGLVRNYNEDRVTIILNILRPPSKEKEPWPKCSFFGIYDGHGGSACADYLRDNLHQFVIKEPSFPWNPREALKKGFENAEKKFLELAQIDGNITERSGSCAVVVLVVEEMCFIANVGDSRALLSRY